jgi:hypothetical protein
MRSFLTGCLLFCLATLAGATDRLDLLGSDHGWQTTTNPPRLVNTKPLRLSTKQYPLLIVEIKQQGGIIGELSWRAATEPFSFTNSLPFYLRGNNKPGIYYLNLAAYNRSGKEIDQLVIFPAGQGDAAVINSLIASSGSLPERLAAAWQEFWGPTGHEPDPFDFLVRRSPRLWGLPVVLYLNLLLFSLLLIALLVRRRFDPSRYFFGVLVIGWLLLEASSLVGNWTALARTTKFWGKPLETKRALSYPSGFYDFIVKTAKKLPPDATFSFHSARGYKLENPAQYYLYPRLLTPEGEYKLQW